MNGGEEGEHIYEKESSKNKWAWGTGLSALSSARFPSSLTLQGEVLLGKPQRSDGESRNPEAAHQGTRPEGGGTLSGIWDTPLTRRRSGALSQGVCTERLQEPNTGCGKTDGGAEKG